MQAGGGGDEIKVAEIRGWMLAGCLLRLAGWGMGGRKENEGREVREGSRKEKWRKGGDGGW